MIRRIDWVFCALSAFLFWQVWHLHSHNHLSPDGAVIGLMARHILEGKDFPVFFYGYAYIGSLKALLAAGLFALFGASEKILLLLPPLFYIGFVWTTYWLGALLGGRKAGRVSMLLTLACSHWLILFSAEIVGGYIDTLFYGNLLLIFLYKWSEGDPWSRWKWSLALGLAGGLAFWQFPLAAYYLAAVVFCLFIVRPQNLFSRHLPLFTGAFYVGSFPFWWHNWNHGFLSFKMVSAAGPAQFFSHFGSFFSHYLPALLGWDFYRDHFLFALGWGAVQILALAALAWLVKETGWRWRDPRAPLLFLFAAVVLLFCRNDYVGDRSPMVALPLLALFPLAMGVFLEALSRYSKILFWGALLLVLSLYGVETRDTLVGRVQNSRAFRAVQDRFAAALEKAGVDRVYAPYYIAPLLAFRSGEKTVAAAIDRELVPGYYEEVSQSPSPGFLISKKETPSFESALALAGWAYKKEEVESHSLFHGISRARRLGREIPAQGWRGDRFAFDRIVTTRWRTPQPQTPGQVFELELPQERNLTGIELQSLIAEDLPRAIRVEISRDGKDWRQVAGGKPAPYFLYGPATHPIVSREFGKMEIAFEPAAARFLRLTQEGKTRFNHWSVHEIYLYEEGEEEADPRQEQLARLEYVNPRPVLSFVFPPKETPTRFLDPKPQAPLVPVNRDRWRAEAAPHPERAGRAIDPKLKTEWKTFASQKAGMYFLLDMGQPEEFSRIELHCGKGLWEYPHRFAVFVSEDKNGWSRIEPSAVGCPWWDGKRQVTSLMKDRVLAIRFPATKGRYLKIELTGDEPSQQWTVADIRLYR